MTRHLIHIGYPKTGSNTLRAWFAAHPQIGFCDGAIAGWRSVYDIASGAAAGEPGILWRVTSGEGLATPHRDVGRRSVDYAALAPGEVAAAQERVCHELGALFPGAAVLILTRGFRAMLLSSYSQYVRTGGTRDFGAFCEAGCGRIWDYDRLIGLYEAAFGAENVIVLPYEGLRDDPAGFVAGLEVRLGLDSVGVAIPALNPALSPEAMAWLPRIARRMPSRLLRRAAAGSAMDRAARLLQRIRPLPLPKEAAVPETVLRRYRGCAARLRTRAAYAPYLTDYGGAADPPSPVSGAAGG